MAAPNGPLLKVLHQQTRKAAVWENISHTCKSAFNWASALPTQWRPLQEWWKCILAPARRWQHLDAILAFTQCHSQERKCTVATRVMCRREQVKALRNRRQGIKNGAESRTTALTDPYMQKHLWRCFGFISRGWDLSDLEHLVIYSGMRRCPLPVTPVHQRVPTGNEGLVCRAKEMSHVTSCHTSFGCFLCLSSPLWKNHTGRTAFKKATKALRVALDSNQTDDTWPLSGRPREWKTCRCDPVKSYTEQFICGIPNVTMFCVQHSYNSKLCYNGNVQSLLW